MTHYTTPDPNNCALITIDVQRDFVLPGAPLEIKGTYEILPILQKIIQAFRDKQRPIIHVVRLYLADGSNADLCRREMIENEKGAVVPGTAGAELLDELKPEPNICLDAELLLSGQLQLVGDQEWIMYKSRWGAFYNTALESHLRSLGVNTLAIIGCNFPNCPRTTIYEASERDFKLMTATDAISGFYELGQREMENIGVNVMTSAQLMSFDWRRND